MPLASFICAGLAGCAAAAACLGPVVDLGYGLWQATVNSSGQYYNFSNIRYGQAPVGDLRFAAPVEPLTNRSIVNDGQDDRICPQGMPSWSKERGLFVNAYLANPTNISAFTNAVPPGIEPSAKPPPQSDGRVSEDCLFLDVLVPHGVYDNRTLDATGGAPVMVWTFGGGFYGGYKDSQGNAAGFLSRSMTNPSTAPGVVYVAMNYRLGALGWLSGPTFTASGGTPNAGLYDQRLAMQWIQKYIHLFGGDARKVTMMGASAGASSTLHQITAYGGERGDAPFQQAVLESPAFSPNPYNALQEQTFTKFLAAANLSTLTQLRAASSHEIIAANSLTIYQASYGVSGGYGPVVDGNFVPQLPTLLLQQGRYSRNVRSVFAGHNTNEGLLFTNPSVQNDTAFDRYISSPNSTILPDAWPSIKDVIRDTLYPANFTNPKAVGYNDTTSRLATLITDMTLTCNVQAALEAFDANKTHAYLFHEGASLHGEETPYMFYNDGPTADAYNFGMVNGTVAETLQNWILTFGATSNPNGLGNPSIPTYGLNRTMGSISNQGLGLPVPDTAHAQRCAFWQKALYV